MNVRNPNRAAAARRLATAVRQALGAADFQCASPSVYANQYREGDVVVQVLDNHAEFLRAREVLGQRWQVRYDRLGHVWQVS